MRLDPGRTLAPATVAAIQDRLPRREAPDVEESELVLLALGAANEETRQACARALLASPSVRGRLARIRTRLDVDLGEGSDGRSERFVRVLSDVASAAGRALAEGRWTDVSATLRRDLSSLRAAWTLGEDLGMREAVETIARAVARPLIEMGERDAFASLVATGLRVADAAPSPDLAQRMLAYQGAEASYRGDSAAARAAWGERLRRCREQGDRVSEADALLDLAEQAQSDGDHAEARATLAVAEPVVAEIGRADYAATLLCHRAMLELREGRPGGALRLATLAREALTGEDGSDVGIFVRMTVARTLARSQGGAEALGALADVLERCVEVGRPVDAASCLSLLSEIVENDGRIDLAGRALSTAAQIGRDLGSRRLASTESQLAAFAGRHPAWRHDAPGASWEARSTGVLDDLREPRGALAPIR